ncbi:MAG TPA: carbohydrate ABC transporter permease [Herpetosiphonaceae bacterium]|nr:carbohydrate ABC transporter permease [Herpetosiphonaceae bacterium]
MSTAVPVPQTGGTPRQRTNRAWLYVAAILLTLFMLLPIYLITIAAFSPRAAISAFPKALVPTEFSTETLLFFLRSTGVARAARNSVIVGLLTLLLSLVLGAPAGYALARFGFRGRDTFKVLILSTRAFPIVILSIPLAVTFISWRLYDTVLAVALAHTALALPTTILVTSSIFVSVPKDVEEAALTLGCTPFGAFWRVVLPLALPGLTASAIFTFVLSWNEVFAATILTVRNRTLPAHVLSTLNDSPLPFRFAGGFALVVPSLIFIFFMRGYLLNMWGRVTK